MKVVQELVAYFDRRGKLSRKQLAKLLEQNMVASEAPSNMHGLCETVGPPLLLPRHRRDRGPAVGHRHLQRGLNARRGGGCTSACSSPPRSAVLRVTIVAPPNSFPGSTRNGVTSTDYGRYGSAYRLAAI